MQLFTSQKVDWWTGCVDYLWIIVMVLYNLGSLEIRTSFCKTEKKRTYMYQSLQFPVEMNTRGS